jgi:FHA domain-containing protein
MVQPPPVRCRDRPRGGRRRRAAHPEHGDHQRVSGSWPSCAWPRTCRMQAALPGTWANSRMTRFLRVPRCGRGRCEVTAQPLSPPTSVSVVGGDQRLPASLVQHASRHRMRRRPSGGAVLQQILTFHPGEFTILGRNPDRSTEDRFLHRSRNFLHRCGTVSLPHASIGLDQDGRAWVCDQRSINGTYLNDQRLPPKLWCPSAMESTSASVTTRRPPSNSSSTALTLRPNPAP